MMERLLDCFRWECTRNELANSRQAAERDPSISRGTLRAKVFPRCAAPNMARASSKTMILRLGRDTDRNSHSKSNVSPDASSAPG